jgi:hypothetical protein
MGWAVGNQIFIPAGARDFYFSVASRLAVGLTQPPVQYYGGCFPGLKQQGQVYVSMFETHNSQICSAGRANKPTA